MSSVLHSLWTTVILQFRCGSSASTFHVCQKLIMSVKIFPVGRDNSSNDQVLNIFNHPYECNAYVFSWIVVDKRTVLNENRKLVHVWWTAKRGNKIDLIGQLNVAWLLGHSRGSARYEVSQKKYRRLITSRTKVFCSIFRIYYILYLAYFSLDFESKIIEICSKLSKMHYFKVEYSKFYKPNFGDF